jgi:putative hydrolase of the HAD superfamily
VKLIEIMGESARPMDTIPTDYPVRAAPLRDILCVVFDIYGTLLISESGDVGGAGRIRPDGPLGVLLREYGIDLSVEELARVFSDAVRSAHARALPAEPFPEVDSAELWGAALGLGFEEAELFSAAWEAAGNRVWAMPGAASVISAFAAAGLRLGIVSNAQAYTPPLFPILLGRSIEEFGFDPGLTFFSWREKRGKPSPRLFASLVEALSLRGIAPERTLFVGNDMLKDLYPARGAGLRTCLFAGDARSLKTRDNDPRCAFEPDAAIDRLDLLPWMLGLKTDEGVPSGR